MSNFLKDIRGQTQAKILFLGPSIEGKIKIGKTSSQQTLTLHMLDLFTPSSIGDKTCIYASSVHEEGLSLVLLITRTN